MKKIQGIAALLLIVLAGCGTGKQPKVTARDPYTLDVEIMASEPGISVSQIMREKSDKLDALSKSDPKKFEALAGVKTVEELKEREPRKFAELVAGPDQTEEGVRKFMADRFKASPDDARAFAKRAAEAILAFHQRNAENEAYLQDPANRKKFDDLRLKFKAREIEERGQKQNW